MTKINKALDYNKYRGKKQLQFPLVAQVKYDGNYTVHIVDQGKVTHYTSGGLTYTHTDEHPFTKVKDGVYLAERIAGKGKLGERRSCSLRGPKNAQTSTGHTYKVFDYITLEDYNKGRSDLPYLTRYIQLFISGINDSFIPELTMVDNEIELDNHLKSTTRAGYEGLILIDELWKWKDTKSRNLSFCKYKKRPTADLLCVGTEEGGGKYTGLIGALILQDLEGRLVRVGSGLSDSQRQLTMESYIGKVVEIEYEQIIATYIQPTFIQIRFDKTKEDID